MYSLKKAKINQNFPITIINAKEQKAFIGVDGKSEQEGTPSPSNPSEIHSVADDVNLLSGLSIYTNSHTISPKLELDTGTYTFSYTGEPSSGIYIRKNDAISGEILLERYNTTEITFTVAEKGDYYIDLYLSGDWHTKTLTNAQLKKGSTLLPCSPYNQGTVTIKQRGKNLFNYTKASDTNNTNVTQYRIFEIDGLKPNTQYNINNMGFTQNLNNQYCYLWNDTTYAGSTDKRALAAPSAYYTQLFFNSNAEGKIYLAIYPTDTTTWESVISYLENAQIEERLTSNRL